MGRIIRKRLHSGPSLTNIERWIGKTKAEPTPLLEGKKQQRYDELSVYLSVKMHWDMPTKLVSEKTVPSRRSAVDHAHISGTETWNNVKALWFDTDINIIRSELANKQAWQCEVIILLKSDYLPTDGSCMLFGHLEPSKLTVIDDVLKSLDWSDKLLSLSSGLIYDD